jgi:hypothetical protein
MKLIPQAILIGTGISGGLTLLVWVTKMSAVFIWIMLPGFLLAWGAIVVLHGQAWQHRDAIMLILVTLGNAAFYSWISFLILNLPKDG